MLSKRCTLAFNYCQLPLSDSRPVCSCGCWPRKSSLVPSFSGQISAWRHPCVGNLQLIYQQSRNSMFSQNGSCLFPTNRKPQIHYLNNVLAGLQCKALYVHVHNLHLHRVHMNPVHKMFGLIPRFRIYLSDCTVEQKSCQITWHSSSWLSED